MAWGISPKKSIKVPLGDFGTDRYLAIVYQALANLDWKVSYADENGFIAYTPISWASYSEQITVIINNGIAHIKSECVGFQALLFDYGKNEKNLELLITEIEYAAFHFKADEEVNLQLFKKNFYQHPGISLEYTPLGAKDKLTHLGTLFIPGKNYRIVPWLIIINCAVFLGQRALLYAYLFAYQQIKAKAPVNKNFYADYQHFASKILGGIERNVVLSGEYWRLLAACFSHGSLLHLVSNMLFLAYIGSIIEGRVGKWNFLGLYIMTGICASLASIGYRYEGLGVGASGAIMGLFGVFLAYLSTNFFDKKARTAFLISTLIITIITLYPSGDKIDHAAHFGGFIAGYIFGWFSYWAYTKTERLKRQSIRSLSYLVILSLAFSSLLFMPKYDLIKYRETKRELVNNLNRVSGYFYSREYRYLPEEKKTVLLDQEALPIINRNKVLLKQLKEMPLPEDEKKSDAEYMTFYEQKVKVYELLYKEYKTGDKKYREQVEKIYNEIREARK